jgi:hypothetical protein
MDMERMLGPLERLNPKGRGPLTLALREAAKALPSDGWRRSLILIHDDADNCQPDLCVLATELRGAGVRAHVISLAPKPEDVAKMTCLPEATGGRLFLAQTAEQAEAAIDDAVRLASISLPTVSESPKPSPAGPDGGPAATLPAASDGRPGLLLRTLLAEGNEPVTWSMHWRVTRSGKAGHPPSRAAPPIPACRCRRANIGSRPAMVPLPWRKRSTSASAAPALPTSCSMPVRCASGPNGKRRARCSSGRCDQHSPMPARTTRAGQG